ncbi:MAG: TIGR02710 family CRISPR-associated protein [Spirulinaceae cyanobacterium RM2_2_10]|nr:TIGR02710 family CRISPR-associated protein [Spirulinaceae cyanobacterium SM2_1_0]NJO20181.1 TIGR02710 family CRISPR-associated protein [Spirulinaceae cyanobacterium RM2_2_10]
MPKILLITVGGSYQPIVTAIRELEPDQVLFICSEDSRSQVIGSGTPCERRRGPEVLERLPNIPTQLSLGDRFQPDRDLLVLEDLDNLSECYRAIADRIRTLRQDAGDETRLLADYTGGTKTMSVALAMASIDSGIEAIYVTTGQRRDLIRIEFGEQVERASTASIVIERLVEQNLPALLAQYNYPAAINELKSLLKQNLPTTDRKRVRSLLNYCIGFDYWDRFDHAAAWNYLEPALRQAKLKPVILFLKRVMHSREQFAPAANDHFQAPSVMQGHGYELVQDLLLNAERRAVLERYDDAVARLYRTLELLAQIRLWAGYGLKTSDLDVAKLPESLRAEYENLRSPRGAIQLGLTRSYVLLSQLPDEPLGALYHQHHQRLQNALQVRNYSLFAHGLAPIDAAKYEQEFRTLVVPFLEAGITNLVPDANPATQFPLAFQAVF